MSSVEVRQGPTLYGLDKELAAKVPCPGAVQTARADLIISVSGDLVP